MALSNIGMDIRSHVLKTAIYIEGSISWFLGLLLGMEDIRQSKVLGNNSSAISFAQKVNLLIEIGALTNDEGKSV